MEADVYTVPAEVWFKNYSTATGPQTRNLLIKNTTSQALHAVVSYPFSPSFRLSAPADLRAELKPNPPHLVLTLPAKSTSKVIVELRPPEPTSDRGAGGNQHLQDALVVLAGGVCSLRVPVRAMPHGSDPAAAGSPGVVAAGASGGAATKQQQHAAVSGTFWPPQKELESHCSSFIGQVESMYDALRSHPDGRAATPPPPPPPPPRAAPGASTASVSAAEPRRPPPPAVVSAAATADVAGPNGGSSSGVRPPSAVTSAASSVAALPGSTSGCGNGAVTAAAAAAAARPAAELPPEGFSRPHDLHDSAGDVMYGEEEDAVQQPYVLHKVVKVQGRVAVAVPAAAAAATADGAAAGGNGGRLAAAATSAGSGGLSLPLPGDSLSRTSSTGSLAAVGPTGAGSRPGSALAGKLAFALNGKLYDARGNALEPSLELLSAATVVDCGDVSASSQPPQPPPAQFSRPSGNGNGNVSTLTPPPRLSPPSPPPPPPSSGSVIGPSPGSGPGSGAAGRVSLAPLKHGLNLPITASLRPGSASSSISASAPLGRPPPPPYNGAGPGSGAGPAGALSSAQSGGCGSGGGGGGSGAAGGAAAGADDDTQDLLRQAALAAALRELGITDLPAPSPKRPPSSGGPSADWARPSGQPSLPPAPSLPSYLQYGLPPNYRPSSGRRRPSSATGSAATAAYDSDVGGRGDDGDRYQDDADLEARLVQQIESNVLKAAGPAAAPAPRRAPGGLGRGTASSPGSYLPPRAGAASSGGLGAPSVAVAAAAAVAAGSRLGKATAAMAGGGGAAGAAARRPTGQSPSSVAGDNDYPEESEFELRLQRQIDSDVANGGGTGRTGGGSAGRSGGGGGAGWRGSGSAVAPRLSGSTGPAAGSGAAAVLKRSSSTSGGGGGGGGAAAAAAGGPRRASAESGTMGQAAAAAARGAGGSAPRQQPPSAAPPPGGARGGGGAAAGSAGPRAPAPKPSAAAGASRTAAVGGKGAVAGKAPTAKVVEAGGPNVQRLKANWDALG